MKIIALISSLLLYCGDSLAEDFSFPDWIKTDIGTRLHHDGAKSVWNSGAKALGSTGFKVSAGYCKYVDRNGKYPDYYSIDIEYKVGKASLVCFQRDVLIDDLPAGFEDSIEKIVIYDEQTREVTITVGKSKWKYTLPVPLDPHVEAVIRSVEGAKGKVEKTADGQSLKLVDLAVPGAGPHDHRTEDPYDAAFFEHLGHITTLESLNIISTKFNDEWVPHIAKLTNLKTLRCTNNGKLTDAGMEQLAGLKNLENFSFVGTAITGMAYAKFDGFTKLVKVSHRGSSINDEGLKQLCDHLPNLESISLAHAKFTDAGAPNLAKLTKLKGLELGASKATPQALASIVKLPLEYLQLGEGFESPACIPLIKGITTLRRLTLTNAAKFTDAELTTIAGLTQLEHLELGKVPFPDERIPLLKDFAFLKSMRLVPGKEPFTPETQMKIKALLPTTEIQWK